jgi:hypothetical protein
MWSRLFVALTSIVVVVASWAAYQCWSTDLARSIESGDSWTLIDSNVDVAHIPGSVEPLASSAGPGVRFVVATSSGGNADCHPPRLVGSTRTESTLTLDLQWQQRGCADVGGEAFELVVLDVPDDGLALVFPVTPEHVCEGAILYADGSVTACRPRH